MRICNSLFFSVLTKEADSGGNVDTEKKGHQPVILGGLYSAVEDEFLPGKTSLLWLLWIIIMVAISALDNEEDSSLSEELAPSHLARRADARRRKGRSVVLQGEHCQYIDFAEARSSGSGCVHGTKMVIKNK